MHTHAQGHRQLLAVSDISCDVQGSIECLARTTSIEAPFLYHRPLAEGETTGEGGGAGVEVDGDGVRTGGVCTCCVLCRGCSSSGHGFIMLAHTTGLLLTPSYNHHNSLFLSLCLCRWRSAAWTSFPVSSPKRRRRPSVRSCLGRQRVCVDASCHVVYPCAHTRTASPLIPSTFLHPISQRRCPPASPPIPAPPPRAPASLRRRGGRAHHRAPAGAAGQPRHIFKAQRGRKEKTLLTV